jgi:hypothetical protein
MPNISVSGKLSEMSGKRFGMACGTGAPLLSVYSLGLCRKDLATGRGMIPPRRLVRLDSCSLETSPDELLNTLFHVSVIDMACSMTRALRSMMLAMPPESVVREPS